MKYLYSIFSFLLLFTANLHSEDLDVNSLPKLLGTSNAGKEFYFTFLPAWENPFGGYLKVYITSYVKTSVTVEVPKKGYKKTEITEPNEITCFTLAPAIGQCYTKWDYELPEPEQVWFGAAVHVIADDPIICYGLTRYYNYLSESFVVLPINILGNDYIVSSFADPTPNTTQWLPSYTGITAPNDSTTVWFTMGGNDSSKTAGGLLPGETSTWKLNKGDVLLFASLGARADLSGSKIISSKPISVVSGNVCADVPVNCGWCNFLEEMEIPTYSWGKTYHVTPIINRKKNSIIKIFAKEPMTNIYRDGEFLGTIQTAGGIEGVGFLHMRADEGEPRPILISGDKPISVTQYNTGKYDDNVVSDPFQMALLPVELYRKEITFNTPGARDGHGFPLNYINLCYESGISSDIPEDIEIAFYNTKDSVFEWYKLKDTLGTYGTPFAIDNEGKQFSSTTFKLPFDGVYKLRADRKFQAYMYGFSSMDSYGMPASVFLDSMKFEDIPTKPNKQLIEIFPNPATDNLIIRTWIGYENESHILIYDLLGKILYQEQDKLLIGVDKTIDLKSFLSGIYYIQISSGKEVITEKFFVVR
ncbi:MAG: T9SS type A sorting domain-containing protein [bacterium]